MNKLSAFNARMDRAIYAATKFHATSAVSYARQNAPWTDRTSNARNGLFARAEREYPKYRIIVGHGVPYGIYLESRWSGRYAIIRPTIDKVGPEYMKTVSTLFGKVLGV